MMLTVKNSITQSLKIIVGSSLMIWLALAGLITDKSKELIGWILLIFFAATFIKGFYHLADRRTKILADKTGIYFPEKKRGFIYWSEVKKIEFTRDNYKDSVFIELKDGTPLRLRMFFLNTPPEELLEQVNKFILDFSALPHPSEPPIDKKKKESGKTVKPEQSVKTLPAQIRASEPESEPEKISTKISGDDEEHINEIADKIEPSIIHPYETTIDSDEDEKDLLNRNYSLPAFFSDDAAINETVWISIISSGVTACLFIYANFDSMGPPKISVSAQFMTVLAAGIIGPVFYFLRSASRNGSYYRSFTGKSSHQKASLKIREKKKSDSKKSDRPDEFRGKKRMKKRRR